MFPYFIQQSEGQRATLYSVCLYSVLRVIKPVLFSVFMCKYIVQCFNGVYMYLIFCTYTHVSGSGHHLWYMYMSLSLSPLLKDTRHDLKRYWMPDSACKECSECGTKFNIIVRRHHCRICGRIFCNACCSLTIPGMKLRPDLQVRIVYSQLH